MGVQRYRIFTVPIFSHEPLLVDIIWSSLDEVNLHYSALGLRHTKYQVTVGCTCYVAVFEHEPLQSVSGLPRYSSWSERIWKTYTVKIVFLILSYIPLRLFVITTMMTFFNFKDIFLSAMAHFLDFFMFCFICISLFFLHFLY